MYIRFKMKIIAQIEYPYDLKTKWYCDVITTTIEGFLVYWFHINILKRMQYSNPKKALRKHVLPHSVCSLQDLLLKAKECDNWKDDRFWKKNDQFVAWNALEVLVIRPKKYRQNIPIYNWIKMHVIPSINMDLIKNTTHLLRLDATLPTSSVCPPNAKIVSEIPISMNLRGAVLKIHTANNKNNAIAVTAAAAATTTTTFPTLMGAQITKATPPIAHIQPAISTSREVIKCFFILYSSSNFPISSSFFNFKQPSHFSARASSHPTPFFTTSPIPTTTTILTTTSTILSTTTTFISTHSNFSNTSSLYHISSCPSTSLLSSADASDIAPNSNKQYSFPTYTRPYSKPPSFFFEQEKDDSTNTNVFWKQPIDNNKPLFSSSPPTFRTFSEKMFNKY